MMALPLPARSAPHTRCGQVRVSSSPYASHAHVPSNHNARASHASWTFHASCASCSPAGPCRTRAPLGPCRACTPSGLFRAPRRTCPNRYTSSTTPCDATLIKSLTTILSSPNHDYQPLIPLSMRVVAVCWMKDQKRLTHGSKKSSRVLGYYGLTPPPYKLDDLEPYISKRTLELHWGGHHHDYVESLNKQLKDSLLYGYTLEELIKESYKNGNPLPEFNNAAEVWNHDFFWESMRPDGGKLPWGGLLQQIEKDFGSFSNFRDEFMKAAMGLFGSGWVWLVLKREKKKLAVIRTSNAFCPLVFDDIPIIALDMWEHAYYLDYKDDREKYISNFMNHLVSWHSATLRIARAEAFVNLGVPKIPVA